MTEPVIDIRDRIEKMRNQMTVPASKITSTEIKVEKKSAESVSSDKAANINVENLEKKIDKNKPEATNKENFRFSGSIQKVASKGGTTEEGLKVLSKRNKLFMLFEKAILSAEDKSKRISKKLK